MISYLFLLFIFISTILVYEILFHIYCLFL